MNGPTGSAGSELGCPECFAMFHSGFTHCPFDAAVLESGVHDRLLGHILNGRYILQELVGVGSVGRVYRARHVRLDRSYAIKILFGEFAANPKARTRFLREATAASRLLHPNLLSVLDVGETERGLVYMVMDFVAGEDLHQVLNREAPVSPARALGLFRQITRGLAYAHDRGVIHRDLKCENVMITRTSEEETARVVDFGIALTQEALEPGQRLTTVGTVLGTPAYMSPEQLCGEEIDQRSDLFGLGVILYRILCGRFPFDGSPLEMANANLNDDPPAPGERVPGLKVDPRLSELALRLMEKDPDDRFASAREVLDHLDGETSSRAGRRDARGSGEPPVARASLELAHAETTAAPATNPIPMAAVAPAITEPTERVLRTHRLARLVGVGLLAAAALLWYASARQSSTRPAPIESASLNLPGPPLGATPLPAPEEAPPTATEPVLAEPTVSMAPGAEPEVDPAPRQLAPARPRAASAPVAPSADDFRRRYVAVGGRLAELAESHGEGAVDPLRQRYFAIPFADSLRSDAIRRDAARVLRDLDAAIDRALK
jgi:eukaryotic-like serine/threonine-protein kinase